MADVQLVLGYFFMPDRLYDAMLDAGLSPAQFRIVVELIRRLYRQHWRVRSNKQRTLVQTVTVSHAELARATRMQSSGGFRSALCELVALNVIQLVDIGGGTAKSTYALQMNPTTWLAPRESRVRDCRTPVGHA